MPYNGSSFHSEEKLMRCVICPHISSLTSSSRQYPKYPSLLLHYNYNYTMLWLHFHCPFPLTKIFSFQIYANCFLSYLFCPCSQIAFFTSLTRPSYWKNVTACSYPDIDHLSFHTNAPFHTNSVGTVCSQMYFKCLKMCPTAQLFNIYLLINE